MAGKKTGKRLLTWVLVLVMALSLLPLNALAAGNSTVVLHPAVGSTVTGVKVKVGDIISGYKVSSISGYYITVDLGKYNVNNNTFRLPYAKDIWEGVDNNKVDYISWAGSGSNRRSEGASALLANGKNTAYYYFKGAPVLLTFTLNYDANGGTGAPASQTYKATSEYEKSHTFTISSQAPTRDGYTFLGWNTNRSATTANYQPNGSIVVTGTTTLYAVWEENTPPKPDKPTAPDEGNLSGLIGDITVKCTNDKATHTPKSKGYALISGSYTTSEVEGDAESGYTYTVTINSQKYVEQFDFDTGAVHTPKDDTAAVTLEYKNNAWLVKSGTPIVFNVVCDAAPDDPTVGENFNFSKDIVDVICETTNNHNDSYGLMNGYYTVSDKQQLSSGNWKCTITIDLAKYFELYNSDSQHPGHTRDMKHEKATAIKTIYPTWSAKSRQWSCAESLIDAAEIYVKCDAVTPPTEPDGDALKELLGSTPVKVECTTKTEHGSISYALADGGYDIGEVTPGENGGYTCTITVTADKYVAAYVNTKGAHELTGDSTKTITLTWNSEDEKWVAEDEDIPVTFSVECKEALFPVELVIYRNGDTSKPYKRVRVAEVAKGTEIKAADYLIENYYDGTNSGGKYDFHGWYNDGKWNDYMRDPANPPAGLEKITVNGWTNLIGMVYDYENVVYFRSAEDLAAYQKDHSKTDGLLYTTTARFGSTLPTADAPTPKRTGYTFTFWSREGQSSDVTGQTVNGWTNLYANLEKDESQTKTTSYTVQHKVDGKIIEEDTKTYTNTAWINETNPTIAIVSGSLSPKSYDGYEYVGMEPEIITDTVNSGTIITLTYEKRTDLSYTVHYYLKNTTKKVADDKTVNGQTFNAVVKEEAIRISGYRVYGDSEKSITIGTGTNEIIFYYTRASRPSASSTSKPTLNTGDHYAYVMGYPDGTVRPNGSITRAEVSAIFFRLLSDKTRDEYFTTESSFTDVKAGAWYNNSIATLEKAGVIVDTAKGGAFRPNEAITRAELAAMLAQFSDAKPVKGVKFSDVSAEHWAYEAIAIAAKMGWIEGYPDGTFRPDATITRAEMMTLVNRALERVPSDEDHLLSKRVMLTFPDCKSGDWFYIAVQEATNSHTYERAATEKNGDEQWTALRANRDWTQLEK